MDDIFVSFSKPKHVQFFIAYINKKHKKMKFAIETETNGSLSSPYVKLFVETKSLLIGFLEKINLVGTYANVISFISLV